MTENTNYDYLRAGSFGTADDHINTIKSLQEQLASVQQSLESAQQDRDEWLRRFQSRSNEIAKVRDSGSILLLCEFVNDNLLDHGLSIDFSESVEDGVYFAIEDATVEDGFIKPIRKSFRVSGTFQVSWEAIVEASNEDEAGDLVSEAAPAYFDLIEVSVDDDNITEFEVSEYIDDINIWNVESRG